MASPPFSLPIPYKPAADDFSCFAEQPGSFLIDSSLFDPVHGRYSFWGIDPLMTFQTKSGFITTNGIQQIASPLESLQHLYSKVENLPFDRYLPFSGGLVGYLGYEWGAALENIAPAAANDPLRIPDSHFGLYDTIVCYDHLEESCRVSSLGLDENLQPDEELAEQRIEQLIQKIRAARKHPPQKLKARTTKGGEAELISSLPHAQYLQAAEKILQNLNAGDCYQVNLTQRFMTPAYQSPWELYRYLREFSPAPYAAFIQAENFQILSSSPECFLKAKEDGTLTTLPIKGTRRRGATKEEDEKLKQELFTSEKDRAELLMITDLERNDLGKVSLAGSVTVDHLHRLETYPQVHHLVSTIRSKRDPRFNIIDCLAALSPGGSITGAPKIRAMEIIRELEPVNRGVYTGAIGWIGPQNTAHLNIAIRTIVTQEATAYFSCGGGIVIDSDPQTEYEESLTKALGMMKSLGL
ncbi:MAG: aminodeoxychorismate synthase component I [Deltaproteobacteria bacterium]|nr:aminodeoxychorismate synthase component I [Deltaproteobacteria bacterium]